MGRFVAFLCSGSAGLLLARGSRVSWRARERGEEGAHGGVERKTPGKWESVIG